MDDFYMRRQEDAAGRFFRKVSEQGPRKGVGGATRQGRYTFTADGTLLGYNNNRGPERMIAMLQESLTKFEGLPKENKVQKEAIDSSSPDEQFARVPPVGGTVIKVYTRVLEPTADAVNLQRCTAKDSTKKRFRHHGFGAAIDHLWVQKEEIAALAKLHSDNAESDTAFALPSPLAARIARFHLADNTRGEPPHWKRHEIRTSDWTCAPATDSKMSITGKLHLETADGSRGFQGTALGSFAIKADELQSLELVVLGDFWGEGRYTRGARPGRNPIGFSFQLLPTPTAADSIPPQGSRWLERYYKADRH